KSKFRWTGHVMQCGHDRWTRAATEWIPQSVKRVPRRPLVVVRPLHESSEQKEW
ncbi:hypothetical protein V3C99_011944, partial [Haemonchus contortus]